MSRKIFDDDCPGCLPALIDPQTNKVYGSDSPEMIAIMTIWNKETTFEDRKAFHDFCCNGSRKPKDLQSISKIQALMRDALKTVWKSRDAGT